MHFDTGSFSVNIDDPANFRHLQTRCYKQSLERADEKSFSLASHPDKEKLGDIYKKIERVKRDPLKIL